MSSAILQRGCHVEPECIHSVVFSYIDWHWQQMYWFSVLGQYQPIIPATRAILSPAEADVNSFWVEAWADVLYALSRGWRLWPDLMCLRPAARVQWHSVFILGSRPRCCSGSALNASTEVSPDQCLCPVWNGLCVQAAPLSWSCDAVKAAASGPSTLSSPSG